MRGYTRDALHELRRILLGPPVAQIAVRVKLAALVVKGVVQAVGGAIFGALMIWAFSDGAGVSGAAAERRALELRAQQLNAQILMPGSPLACLESVAGEKVEAACEKALFASPASVASASAYVAAQLTLLANVTSPARSSPMTPRRHRN